MKAPLAISAVLCILLTLVGQKAAGMMPPRLVKILERPAGQQFASLPSPREESSRQAESAAVPNQQPVTSVRAQGALP